MMSWVRDHLNSALFPRSCSSCEVRPAAISNGNSCEDCWERTKIFDGSESVCEKCGRPDLAGKRSSCRQCEGHHYHHARSIGVYSHALQSAVVSLKREPHLPSKIDGLLTDAFRRNRFDDSTLLVPVPLSKQRRLERGFNQAELIAIRLGKLTDVQVDRNSLVRTKHSQIHRVGMDEKARDLSVRDSFAVVRPRLIDRQKILLVDDVLTTGATASYCAKVLLKSGATHVNVLTLARAV